ncbi:uncharacterized protein LOC111702943 isoform X2 [Eurytemora carolleeae]|uniref:uncharacterized protein LOC111702943 isoform X2 n=1 Tax=Eurytemora carolleeae TaxID=1294199 RepID=UPI000C764ACC|nr:uncharacterized protein LOC111702943 isoform X2 [Eurytemora carolleeae]|eukprot:XP_023330530.1 uncharacterized protein LOC111702943 isoform X2 [Eurytemora affinis]
MRYTQLLTYVKSAKLHIRPTNNWFYSCMMVGGESKENPPPPPHTQIFKIPVLFTQEVKNVLIDYQGVQEMLTRNLNEIIDLNEGERFVKLFWNDFIREIHGLGHIHLPNILEKLVTNNGLIIFQENIYRNFVIMLSSFHEAGLVDNYTFFKTIQSLQERVHTPASPASPEIRSRFLKRNSLSHCLYRRKVKKGLWMDEKESVIRDESRLWDKNSSQKSVEPMIIEISDSTESTDSEPDSDQTLDKFLKSIQSSQSTLNPTAQKRPKRCLIELSESENLEEILSSTKCSGKKKIKQRPTERMILQLSSESESD